MNKICCELSTVEQYTACYYTKPTLIIWFFFFVLCVSTTCVSEQSWLLVDSISYFSSPSPQETENAIWYSVPCAPSLHSEQDLDPFSRFCTALTRDRETDRRTNRHTTLRDQRSQQTAYHASMRRNRGRGLDWALHVWLGPTKPQLRRLNVGYKVVFYGANLEPDSVCRSQLFLVSSLIAINNFRQLWVMLMMQSLLSCSSLYHRCSHKY